MTEPGDKFLGHVAETYAQVGPADPDARARIVARIRRESVGAAGRWRAGGWAAALGLLLVGGAAGWLARGTLAPPEAPPALDDGLAALSATGEVRIVQFVLAAPRAGRVAVVGDFNDWDPGATPLRRLSSGSWVAAIPLPPGRHVYAFIIDGERWVPDPAAPLAPEDGFGIRNSVIVVGPTEAA